MTDTEKINEITENEEVTTQPETDETSQEEVIAENSELDAAKEQIAALSDKHMRLAAEFDNYKKRTAREKEDYYKSAVCDTIAPLLAVLDNLERAVVAAENAEDVKSVLDGVKMVKKQFEDTLTSIGVSAICAVGNEFDPEKHNAVMSEESDEPENTVIDELQKGYTYKDKVIRHSMVKVSR